MKRTTVTCDRCKCELKPTAKSHSISLSATAEDDAGEMDFCEPCMRLGVTLMMAHAPLAPYPPPKEPLTPLPNFSATAGHMQAR